MLQQVLNRYLLIGAVCACIWSAILPLIPLRLEVVRMGVAEIQVQRALSQAETRSVIVFGVCAMVLLLAPFGIGWFVARGCVGAFIEAASPITARFGALGGAMAVGLGMLPLTTIIVFWNLGRAVFSGGMSGLLAWLGVVSLAVSLGAMGGAFYVWLRAAKVSCSRGMAENASRDFDTLS